MIYLSSQDIDDAVQKAANMLLNLYGKDRKKRVIALIVMDGAMFFAADLLRKVPCINFFIHTIKVKSYTGFNQSKESITEGFPPPSLIKDQDILIIDDIYETGRTISNLTFSLKRFKPNSVVSCTLLSRVPLKPEICGIELETDVWLKGYGMNNNQGTERHLRTITSV